MEVFEGNRYLNMKIHFNFYDVPDRLIYDPRPYLEDFDVENKSSINHFIEQRLFDRFNRFRNYEEFVTDLFNQSYYICTMAQAERKPENRFGAYMEYVSHRMRGADEYMAVLFSMIRLQMWVRGWDKEGHMVRLANLFDDELCKPQYALQYKDFYCQIPQDAHAGDNKLVVKKDEFRPRKVTYQLLKDINEFWPFLSNVGADERDVKNFIFAIGKTEEEQKLISNFLYNELAPLFKNNDEEKWFFKHIEDEIYKHNHADEIRAKKEQEDAEFEAMMEEEAIKEMLAQQTQELVPKLTEENKQLREELEQAKKQLEEARTQKQETSSDDKVKLLAQNDELLNRISDLEEELREEKAKPSGEELKRELKAQKEIHEAMIVELLQPAFYGTADNVREFLKTIQNLDNPGVTDVVRQWMKDNKILPSKKGRAIWKFLHAAKLYSATEQNWNAALRKDDEDDDE